MTQFAPSENIALLIDADNAPAARIEFIISELASYGVVNIRRAYGNWKKAELTAWEKALHEYAIKPIQQFDLVKGKNAADMALLIDAMDILYTKGVGTFCLVSSDCDFTPLVLRLRADGRQVIGFGGQKAAVSFVNSCTRFLYLDSPPASNGTAVAPPKPLGSTLKHDTKLMDMLVNAVRARTGDEGWANLSSVGDHISNRGSFHAKNYGFSKLSELVQAIDAFEVRTMQDPKGTRYLVRHRCDKSQLSANV